MHTGRHEVARRPWRLAAIATAVAIAACATSPAATSSGTTTGAAAGRRNVADTTAPKPGTPTPSDTAKTPPRDTTKIPPGAGGATTR
jgi:hypothetical protein